MILAGGRTSVKLRFNRSAGGSKHDFTWLKYECETGDKARF